MSPTLRLVFLGSDPIALPLLDWLATDGLDASGAGCQLVGIFTQPDRATGRGQVVTPNAIKTWGQVRRLPIFQPEKLTPEVREELAGLQADVALVMAYGHILRDDFITTPRLGTLNLHTSLLPKFRGASPIQTAIAAGEQETGVTLMRIIRRLDAGPIADVARVAIDELDTAADLEGKLAQACVPLVERTLPKLAAGTLAFREQDDAAATYCRKLEKSDGVIDFTAPAAAIAARINGLYPWPSCTVPINGQTVKLGLAEAIDADASGRRPGEVLGPDEEGLLVSTGSGVVRLRRLQRPGGKMLPATDFLRGFPVTEQTVIPSVPMPELITRR